MYAILNTNILKLSEIGMGYSPLIKQIVHFVVYRINTSIICVWIKFFVSVFSHFGWYCFNDHYIFCVWYLTAKKFSEIHGADKKKKEDKPPKQKKEKPKQQPKQDNKVTNHKNIHHIYAKYLLNNF